MLRTVSLFACLTFAFVQPSAAEQLSAPQIKQFIGGKRVLLATPYGLEFPLVYRNNGSVTGDAKGFGLSRLITPKETGRWWVSNNQMCQQFKTWYKGKRFCFQISKTGPKSLRWVRNDGLKGTARIN